MKHSSDLPATEMTMDGSFLPLTGFG